jgi:N-acetylglucosaminyldiphosphoundecaprenol N-acetyl-beta-D-mannosaminyltransferase
MHRVAAQALEPTTGRPAPEAAEGGQPPRLATADWRQSTVLGIPIELAPPADLLRRILAWKPDGRPRRVMYADAQVLNRSRELPDVARALSHADMVYCDSAAVRMAARALDLPAPARMRGPDWIWDLAAQCESTGRSLYLLGAEPLCAREAGARLARSHPALEIAGSHHGCADLDSPQNERLIEDINARSPDIVLVGMATPKQELWMERCAGRLGADVVWTVGGLLDELAGRTPRVPRAVADAGLEWAFRLAADPRGQWRRCVVDNPVFLARVLDEARRRRAGRR